MKRRSQKELISECGLRPLRAIGSIYEPEAMGAFAWAPAGMRKEKPKLTELFAGGIVQAIHIKLRQI
jgi:hypothetical protein